MFIGDLFLGFHSPMFFTYTSLIIAVVLGLFINKFKLYKNLFCVFMPHPKFYEELNIKKLLNDRCDFMPAVLETTLDIVKNKAIFKNNKGDIKKNIDTLKLS